MKQYYFKFCQIFILLIVAIMAISMMGLVTLAAVEDQETDQAVIIIMPMRGEIAENVNIYGAGFIPGEKVKIILKIGNVSLQWAAQDTGGVVVANEYGAFKLTPRGGIPAAGQYAKPGVYAVRAIGDKGSKAIAPLEILEKGEENN